jgi:CubicO group peptidase (beta-lactamase class C family)
MSLSERLKKKLRDEIYHDEVGVALGLIDGKDTVYEFLGDNNLDESTLFEIGSLTKSFTGLLLAILDSEDLISLDQTLSDILDGLNISDTSTASITLEELALHTSGLPRLPDNIDPDDISDPYADYLEDDLVSFLEDHELDNTSRGNYNYSNLGYGLLGYVMERVTGKKYESLLREYIAGPLDMTDTLVRDREEKRVISCYDEDGNKTSRWHNGVLVGDGGVISTVSDLSTFVLANMYPKATPLTESIIRVHGLQGEVRRAYGWMIKEPDIYWHNGRTGGFSSFWGFNNTNKKGVVLLANGRLDQDIIGEYLES